MKKFLLITSMFLIAASAHATDLKLHCVDQLNGEIMTIDLYTSDDSGAYTSASIDMTNYDYQNQTYFGGATYAPEVQWSGENAQPLVASPNSSQFSVGTDVDGNGTITFHDFYSNPYGNQGVLRYIVNLPKDAMNPNNFGNGQTYAGSFWTGYNYAPDSSNPGNWPWFEEGTPLNCTGANND